MTNKHIKILKIIFLKITFHQKKKKTPKSQSQVMREDLNCDFSYKYLLKQEKNCIKIDFYAIPCIDAECHLSVYLAKSIFLTDCALIYHSVGE
jgi:hypothetical protein